MSEVYSIAGYARISVDDEQDQKNISIENQKLIIDDYVKKNFPGSALTFFEDRDRSGYTFDQREGYQEMRRKLINHRYDILVVKDFSRFSRRNSRGLVELEDLRDAGVRIISIGDCVDFPSGDDWTRIQFQFILNEMPVTDTSRKVRTVVRHMQTDGEWICAAPYGYSLGNNKNFDLIPTEAATVRKIFELYNNGWGYKRIANYLTECEIPTPRMSEKLRSEASGKKTKRKAGSVWAIVSVQGILDNDFYIGTLRQGKYTRAKINGKDIKRADNEQIIIENHHQPIIDRQTFAATRSLREKRSRTNYRGIKVYDNVYSGFLKCGDCGSPMFAMSRSDLAPAYTCGAYHKRGLKGCTSHHIRTDLLDELMKGYVRKLSECSSDMIEKLNKELKAIPEQASESELSADKMESVINDIKEELKYTKRQRIREIMKKPEREAAIEAVYDELENELQRKLDGLNRQLELLNDKRNAVRRINRTSKNAIDIFNSIIYKERLERTDLELLIERILIYEDHLEIELKADIDSLMHSFEEAGQDNANKDVESAINLSSTNKKKKKTFRVNVINEGDPLEIYTDREGEVIFKKYSPIGELNSFAAQYAETLHKTCDMAVIICDRDAIIACAGLPKKEYYEKAFSSELESIIESRTFYHYTEGSERVPVTGDGDSPHYVSCAMPITSEGDIIGCVASIITENVEKVDADAESKLIQTAATFLGKQLDS